MDSMRPLTNSLPPARRRIDQPELLTDFKAAALSVTNLYKTAAAAQDRARIAGYQDAVEDLLSFLDREELGLMDGEGWRVRQWATERLSEDAGGMAKKSSPSAESDEDVSEGEENGRKGIAVAATLPTASSELSTLEEPPRRAARSEPPEAVPTLNEFAFRSNHIYPSNHEREGMDVDASAPNVPNTNDLPSSTPSTPQLLSSETPTPASVRIMTRPSRRGHSNHNRTRAANNGSLSAGANLGAGAGSKRKLAYSDFFDISGVNFEHEDQKDGGAGAGKGGSKRGRYV